MRTNLKTTRLSAHIGVAVEGFDVGRPASPDEAQHLRDLFDRHHLILIRGQQVEAAEQVRFASIFETVVDEAHNGTFVGYVSNRRPDSATPLETYLPWHSDYGWTPRPDSALCLYADEISGSLAPTRFASNVRALRALPPELRARISSLNGLMMVDLSEYGTVEPTAVVPRHVGSGEPEFPTDEHNYPRAEHPLVYRHPRTGDDLLFVQQWYSVLVDGLTYADAQELHRQLFDVLYDERFTYEHDWRAGDLVIWDNLALQHGRPTLKRSTTGVRTLRRVVMHPAYEEVLAFSSKLRDSADARSAAM